MTYATVWLQNVVCEHKGVKIMRKIIAAEFMTIDGVIQNEEADGDGFKYGGWFFPVAVRGDGRRGAGEAGETDGSAVGAKDL